MKPPLLFIHGAFTRAGRWRPWIERFEAAGYRCLAPSLPAHDPPDREALSRLTFANYVDAMVAEYESLGEPAIVIGSSMGGLIAQHVAVRTNPRGLVLISSAAPWRGGSRAETLPYAALYFVPVLLGLPLTGSKRAARKLVLHDLTRAEQDELLAIFADESGKAYRTMVLGGPPLAKGAVRCPVFCISGGGDRLFKPTVGESIAAFYDAEHLVFPEAGHTLASGDLAKTITSEIMGWIEGLAAPRPPASLAAGAVV